MKVKVIKDKHENKPCTWTWRMKWGKWRPGSLPAGPGWLRMAQLLSGAFPEGDSRGSRGKHWGWERMSSLCKESFRARCSELVYLPCLRRLYNAFWESFHILRALLSNSKITPSPLTPFFTTEKKETTRKVSRWGNFGKVCYMQTGREQELNNSDNYCPECWLV